MRIIRRYAIREFFPSFFLGFFIFTFVLFISNIFPLARILFHEAIEAKTVGRLLFYIISLILPYSISMGVLLGGINCMGRLSYDGEITGLKSCGLSPYTIIIPVSFTSVVISLFCLYLFSEVSPSANLGIKQIQEEFKIEKISPSSEENVLMDNLKNYKIYIDRIEGGRLEGITVFKLKEGGTPSVIIAREGRIITDPEGKRQRLKLLDGMIDDVDEQDAGDFLKGRFRTYYIDLEPARGIKKVKKKPWDMKIGELRKNIEYFKRKGLTPFSLVTEMHKRFSLSFSPLFFVLIGSILGVKMKGKSRTKGFGLSIPVILIYYVILLLGEKVSQKGIFSPFFLMWLPNILLAGLCLPYLFRREL